MVRRLLDEGGLTASDVAGTGIGGRITREDVQREIDRRSAPAGAAPTPTPSAPEPVAAAPVAPVVPAPAPAPAAPAPTPVAPAPVAPVTPSAPAPVHAAAAGERVEPFNRIRQITGERMLESRSVAPHVITAVEVDYEAVERARATFNTDHAADEGFNLTYLPFIVRAVVDAVAEFPRVNATVTDEGLALHGDVNVSIAVDLNFEGLLAPVLKSAGDRRLRAIARDIRGLAQRARNKQVTPEDLSGGTFTISNSGSYGTLFVAPIINQPQVAILSTDGVRRRPVVVTDQQGAESLAIHSVGVLTLCWDHRAFDGAYAAAFMRRLREILETRDWNAEL